MFTAWTIVGTYLGILGLLAVYGVHRMLLVGVLQRAQSLKPDPILTTTASVTVQLPVYNEPAVITRLIDAVAQLDWPKDQLQIQVLDDSTDITSALADRAVARWRARDINIEIIRRATRTGYKAGALAHGLHSATGRFIAILDADFVPNPDFLHKLLPHFSDDVGMVQARWGHLNRNQSWLTRMQAMLLDGHFVVEHAARHASGRFFNFNGTAGVWRRQCIEAAGGWTHDTITEDLDLSYRAQIGGWRFVFLRKVVVPAELPQDMPAFLTQQHRWAKGTVQTARKLLGKILRAPLPWKIRLEALIHLTCPVGYPLLILLAVLLPPAVSARAALGMSSLHLLDLGVVAMTTGSIALFYAAAIRGQGRSVRAHLAEIPLTMALGVGMAPSQTLAVFDGLVGNDTTFVRTPKHGEHEQKAAPTSMRSGSAARVLTWGLALYYAGVIPWAIIDGHWGSLAFMLLFAIGFWMVSLGILPPVKYRQPAAVRTETDEAPAAK